MSRLYKAFRLPTRPCANIVSNATAVPTAKAQSKRSRLGHYISNKFTRASTNIGSWFHKPHDTTKPSRLSSSRIRSRILSKLAGKPVGPYTASQTMAESLHFPNRYTYYNRPSTQLLRKRDIHTWKSVLERRPVLITRNFSSSSLPDSQFSYGHYMRATRRLVKQSNRLLTWAPQPRNQVASDFWQVKRTSGKTRKGNNSSTLEFPQKNYNTHCGYSKRRSLARTSPAKYLHDTSNIKKTNIFDLLSI